MNRVVASLALGLMFACFVSWPAPPVLVSDNAGTAYAQTQKAKAKAKVRTTTKTPPKTAPKGPPPRIPFTADDQAAATVPGFPDARVWGDTAEGFQKVLPPAKGPWLAMSGGGADGAFAAGVLNGWTQSGKRPEFKIAKNVSAASAKGSSAAGPDPNKVYPIAAGSAPFMGSAKAKVTILHYFDYQCPFCVKMEPTFDQILKDYPDDVRVVFKMHPLAMHKEAMSAAEAVLAAHAQGKFAEMHAKLFANMTSLSRDKYLKLAGELGLDMKKFTSDLDNRVYKKTIDAETAEVVSIGATGTPASFVNGRFLSGAQPVAAFKKIIDEELAKEIAKAAK